MPIWRSDCEILISLIGSLGLAWGIPRCSKSHSKIVVALGIDIGKLESPELM